MSHFSHIKTQIRHLDFLQCALSDLGVNWKSGSSEVRGYQNQTRVAQLIIQQDNGYDIGFSWNGEEYEVVTDLQFWQQAWSVDRFLSLVSQRYAYHTVLATSSHQGFQMAEQHQNQDGSIRLVLQRWNG